MYKKFALCFTIHALLNFQLAAQQYFKYNDTLEVFDQKGTELSLPWLGGFNTPQYSEIDANKDGIKDLAIFDRYSRKTVLLLRDDEGQFKRSYYDEFAFPYMKYWMILKDYNKDGLADLFYGNPLGVGLYKNMSSREQFSFKEKSDVLKYENSSGTMINIYIPTTDIPIIDDVDSDGDIDILSFWVLGSSLSMYSNVNVNLGLGTFLFDKTSTCWGGFEESDTSNALELNACGGRSVASGSRHSGSTIAMFDGNGDGKNDILIGDISYPNLTFLQNGGTNRDVNMVSQQTLWPSQNESVDMDIFPAAYRVDVDQDGLDDILTAYNNTTYDSRQSTWYYRQTEEGYILQQKDYLQDVSLDFGELSNPHLFDVNEDGLMDLLVTYKYYNEDSSSKIARIAYLKNIGSDTIPKFRIINENWSDIASFEFSQIDITSADVDGDEQDEIIIGDQTGVIHLFEFIDSNISLSQANYLGIEVDRNACPAFIDIDNDDDLDLIIGDQSGQVKFYRNINGIYTLEDSDFDAIDTKSSDSFYGNANPQFFIDGNKTILLIGSKYGKVYKYQLEGETLSLVVDDFSKLRDGEVSAFSIGDLNNDGLEDLVQGNIRGGLSLFYGSNENPDPNLVVDVISIEQEILHAFPNPFERDISINDIDEINNIQLIDISGRIFQFEIENQLSTSHINAGFYILNVEYKNGKVLRKKMIKY